MNKIKILWVDDEIDFLKSHILFLEQKNYEVTTCYNGLDAIDLFEQENFDIVFLDENMPGKSGLDTLSEMKEKKSSIPIIMITKSEEEHIMEDAIGSKISDFLIKPVNPNQILLSLKKNLDNSKLIFEKTSLDYQKEFLAISTEITSATSFENWVELYKKLVFWELELDHSNNLPMTKILESQKNEANTKFAKYIEQEYHNWFLLDTKKPVLSHSLFRENILPHILKKDKPVLLLVIDNLRYDQWKIMQSTIENYYKVESDTPYFSILPTATQYARNAIFSGLTPLEMEKEFPQYWKNDPEEGGKNLFEAEFLAEQIKRFRLDIKHEYIKITNWEAGKKLAENFKSYKNNDFLTIVYNFVDTLSHAKTDMDMLKELAYDNKSYRSLTLSWFKNSPLIEIIQKAQSLDFKLIITTDHGTINIKNPSKVIGDKYASLNLRYKTGRSLTYENKQVYAVKEPKKIGLPNVTINSSFIFAKNEMFLVYQNNFNYYANYYKNTYQHGGVSLEEMIIPFVVLSS